ncbi:NAD-dependent epimerase/dehydratase family protein [Shigella flexneri]
MAESELLQGTLEPTNEPYAIAKIAGIKLWNHTTASTDAITAESTPTNLYGPHAHLPPE